jgi:hypothetical protein
MSRRGSRGQDSRQFPPPAARLLFGESENGGTVRVLLDCEADKLVFEFITDADLKPKILPPPKQEESFRISRAS